MTEWGSSPWCADAWCSPGEESQAESSVLFHEFSVEPTEGSPSEMADYLGQMPVKTVNDNSFSMKIVDGLSGDLATRKLSIAQVGDAVAAGVNDISFPMLVKGADGNYRLMEMGAHGLKTQLSDGSGNELSFIADGEAVAAQKGLAMLGSDGTNFQLLALTSGGVAKVELQNTSIAVTFAAPQHVIVDSLPAIDVATLPTVELKNVEGVDGAAAPARAVAIGGKDASGNLQTLAVDSAGNAKVVFVDEAGITEACQYGTANLAKDASANFDLAVPAGQKFNGHMVHIGARGAAKIQIGLWDGTTFTPKHTYFQQPAFNPQVDISCIAITGSATAALRVIVTNLDGGASDVYANLSGNLKPA